MLCYMLMHACVLSSVHGDCVPSNGVKDMGHASYTVRQAG